MRRRPLPADGPIAWTELSAAGEPPCLPDDDGVRQTGAAETATQVGLRVSVKTLGALLAFFRADPDHERLCLLLGRPWRARPEGEYVVELAGFAAVPCETASAFHVRMSGGDWIGIWPALEGEAGAQLLGWAHSHPGHGAFLSATDLATQACWFARSWSVALVFDPRRDELKCFAGPEGRPAHLLVEEASRGSPREPVLLTGPGR